MYELSNPMNQSIGGNRELVGKALSQALPELEGQGLLELLEINSGRKQGGL